MARTTVTAVREILDTALEDSQVNAFISDATLWVDEELGTAGYSDQRLELLVRYLAAALVRVRDLGLKSTQVKDVSEAYQVDPQVTDYLLRAASFDTTGKIRQAFLAKDDASDVKPPKFLVGHGFQRHHPRRSY